MTRTTFFVLLLCACNLDGALPAAPPDASTDSGTAPDLLARRCCSADDCEDGEECLPLPTNHRTTACCRGGPLGCPHLDGETTCPPK